MESKKIILDCDPGHDDAVAIMLAAKHPKLELLGITVVAGNQTMDKTVMNALNIVQHLELDVPVYAGGGVPMVRKPVVAGDIHGESGLDGPVFEPLKIHAQTENAISFIVRTLMESPEKITIVTTGPMTNFGIAMRLEPKIIDKIKEIVLMGGCYQNGNVTPAAEFNIFADPEAAYVCFTSGLPITMVGLDVSRQTLCYPEIVDRMKKIGNKASDLFVDLMTFFNKTQKEIFGWEGGPLHDPITIAYLIDSKVLKSKPMHATIDISGGESYGRTNCDYFGYMKKVPTANVGTGIDVERFWNIVEDTLKMYR
ncbi:MAG: nucleoside hydrolase [Peptoniphilaceae bacterium]|nr:nucleoside hydrolase [Peptoniphilaceae bacterium]